MNNLKLLSVAVLLVLAQPVSALIEVEPNNNSSIATVLTLDGIENVGQLSNGNDVDFYSIDASKDISLTFACNSRAVAQNNNQYGWYLTIHDDKGELQSSYQVVPEECVTGTTTAKGPYNFRIQKLEETNRKYYLSIVGDCGTTPPRLPVFNAEKVNDKNNKEQTIIGINGVDRPATNKEITNANNSLNTLENTRDAFEIALQPIDIELINQQISTAKNRISTNGNAAAKLVNVPNLLILTVNRIDAVNNYISIANAIMNDSDSKAKVNSIKVASDTLNRMLNSISTLPNANMITVATNSIINAQTIITEEQAITLRDAINNLNNLNTSIDNLNAIAGDLNITVSTIQNVCSAGNTANYTIKDNPDTGITPYKENNIKNNLTVLGKENSGQNGSVADVDFFELAGSESSILPIKFACAKSNAKGKDQGWVISAWQTNENDQGQWKLDKPAFVYQVSPADCNAPEVYTMDLKPYEKNYIIGVQSACALPPVNTESILRTSYNNYLNSADLDYLCDANTANFTLKRDLKTATPLVVDVPKIGAMNSRSDYDLFVFENDQVNDYLIDLSCSQTIATTENKPIWKLSVYDDSDKLVPNYPQLIKASDCNKNSKTIDLPNGVIRSYITLEPVLPLDTSKYTITKTIKKIETVNTPEPEKLTGTDGASVLLSAIEKGRITKSADTFNYYVDGSSLKETQLSFSCNSPEILFGNNWKVSIYQNDRTLKDTHVINSSDCIPDKTTGQSAYTITLPKEAARFYLQVKSTCEDANCKIDQSEFEIMRKIETVTTSTEDIPTSTPVGFTPFASIDTKKIAVLDKLFKKRIKKADEIHFYSVESSLENEIFVQFACDKNASATGWTIGIWEYDVENSQNAGWLYEKQTVLPAACVNDKVRITIPSNSSAHLVSVQSSCLAEPVDSDSAINLEQAKICKVNTSNYILEKGTVQKIVEPETSTVETPVTPPVVTVDSIISALKTAKKISTSQKNQIKSATDIHTYYVDAGVQTAANFEFSCPNSNRFTNDWILLTYDSTKKLQSTKIINGSDCGTGQIGDVGTFKFSALSDSTRTYFVVKSACEKGDDLCEVDLSQYQIKRILPSKTTTNNTGISNIAPCFHDVCDVVKEIDFPVFGGN